MERGIVLVDLDSNDRLSIGPIKGKDNFEVSISDNVGPLITIHLTEMQIAFLGKALVAISSKSLLT